MYPRLSIFLRINFCMLRISKLKYNEIYLGEKSEAYFSLGSKLQQNKKKKT